jgi:hypothetical protein
LDIYRYIRDNGGFDAFEIVPIQKIENISNKTELRIAERAEMEKFSGLKNMRGSYLSTEEYQEKQRLWRENNPEKHAENCRKWAKNNPEKIKEKNRKYVEENSEKIKEYKRQYYQKKKQLKNNDQ